MQLAHKKGEENNMFHRSYQYYTNVPKNYNNKASRIILGEAFINSNATLWVSFICHRFELNGRCDSDVTSCRGALMQGGATGPLLLRVGVSKLSFALISCLPTKLEKKQRGV